MGSVSELPQLSKSRSTPAEQVGKQIEGGFGWRASAGRAGRCGGCTDGGAIGGELVAQPALASSSGSSISTGSSNLLLAIMNHSIDASAPSLFGVASCPLGQPAGLGGRGAELGEILARSGGVGARTGSTCPLDTGCQQCSGEAQAEGPEHGGS
nr:hypothetical protein [uncultured Variovorax sp.]